MANLLKWLQQAVSSQHDPNQVREVSNSLYSTVSVVKREECMMLFGPLAVPQKHGPDLEFYDAVVQSSKNINQCLCLYRCEASEDAEARFNILKNIIPLFLEVRPELYNTGSLQKICDASRKRPDWRISHIAVALDMADLLSNEKLKPFVNQVDNKGVSALMLAASLGSKHITQAVVDAEASLEGAETGTDNNVFHMAAETNGSVIEIVAESSQANPELLKKLLNQTNLEGKTPLHYACLKDRPDVVLAMLCAGADINTLGASDSDQSLHTSFQSVSASCVKEILKQHPNQLNTKDMKNGGTPLHWATDKAIVEALINAGCDIHARNFLGKSALHAMIAHNRFNCAVTLLAHGACVEDRDPDGNTALHLAAAGGNIPTIEAVLAFNGDFNAKNKSGEKPWDIILRVCQSRSLPFGNKDKDRNRQLYTLYCVGARGPEELKSADGSPIKEFSWEPGPEEPKNRIYKRTRHLFDDFLDQIALNVEHRKGGLRILTLDGGGIKGLVLCKMLSCMSDIAGTPIFGLFDWIGGTSTGGMLTLAMACGRSPSYCLGLYFRLKDKVFVGGRPYEVHPLEEFLKAEFTEEKTMSSLPAKPRLAVTGTVADRHPADLHIFRNYVSPMNILGVAETLPPTFPVLKKPDQQEVWRAARCSGAAPSYFRASGMFVDGGMISNNPTLDILTEVHERNCALRAVGRASEVEHVSVAVSLGTGEPPLEKSECVADLFMPTSVMNVTQWFSSVKNFANMLIDQACSSNNRVVDRARAWCSMAQIAYIRLSPQLDLDLKLDETNDEVLVHMLWRTQAYMYDQRGNVEKLVQILTQEQE